MCTSPAALQIPANVYIELSSAKEQAGGHGAAEDLRRRQARQALQALRFPPQHPPQPLHLAGFCCIDCRRLLNCDKLIFWTDAKAQPRGIAGAEVRVPRLGQPGHRLQSTVL